MTSYFITATDTGAGKTFVASALAKALKNRGIDAGVMKPVESGCAPVEGKLVPEDAEALKKASGSTDPLGMICPYMFKEPLSPHLAARLSGTEVDLDEIKRVYIELSKRHEVMIVEGAGGILAPLTDAKTVADLALLLALPVIIVAPSRLGVINHTLLTIEAARSRGLDVRAVVLNNTSPAIDESMKFNLTELRRLTSLPVFELPYAKKEAPDLAVGGLVTSLFL